MRVVASVVGAIIFVTSVAVGAALASPQLVGAAKKAGLPATNCQYCHTEAMPKKETFKPESLNDRGKFLLDDKKARNLKTVDVEKLKNFDKK
jgi:hypothetical protein